MIGYRIHSLASSLAWLVFSFAVLSLAVSVWIVVRSYSPVLSWDQWDTIHLLVDSHGHIGFAQLWSQHNEHRIVVGHILNFADLYLFGGRNISLLIEIGVIQICHCALFLFIAREFGRFRGMPFVTVAGFLIFCFFSPLQMQNFVWGFQADFLMAGFAASVCFACALWYASNQRAVVLIAALFAAFVSECSLANGVLTWPLLLLLAFFLHFGRRERWIIVLTGFLAITVYLIGYHTPGHHAQPLETLRKPLKIVKFVLTYFGSSWDGRLPNPSPWPTISESIAAIAILFVLFRTVQFARDRGRRTAIEAFLLAEMLFCLGTAAITALGRINFGYTEAMAGRYQSIALVFWASVAMLIILSWDSSKAWQTIAINGTLLVLLLSTGSRWKEEEQAQMSRQETLAQGWDALIHGNTKAPALDRLYSMSSILPVLYEFMQRHGWGPKGDVLSYARVEPGDAAAPIRGFAPAPKSCLGSIDAIGPAAARTFYIPGWAYLLKGSPASRIAITSADGTILAFAPVQGTRPDVAKALSKPAATQTGWSIIVPIPEDGTYHVFAIDDEANSACQLPGEIKIDRK